jgi:hypothetical protein
MIVWSELANVGGECVEKRLTKNVRHVVCKVKFDVVADCDNTVFAQEMIGVTCDDSEPGRTPTSEFSSANPACSTFVGVFG